MIATNLRTLPAWRPGAVELGGDFFMLPVGGGLLRAVFLDLTALDIELLPVGLQLPAILGELLLLVLKPGIPLFGLLTLRLQRLVQLLQFRGPGGGGSLLLR